MSPYSAGQLVTLTASPDAGQSFVNWSGDASSTINPLVVTMDASKVITVNFTKGPSLRVGTPLEGLVEDGFRLTINGDFGAAYQVLGTTNFADWLAVGVVTNLSGTIQLSDPAARTVPRRIYRAVLVQP
jgi:hypothetical protein